MVTEFTEKTLLYLNQDECHKYYVYALLDPKDNRVFYIGKGTGNRVFSHENESHDNPESFRRKLATINEIENRKTNNVVKKYLLNWHLTESEAFAAEAALINLFNFVTDNDLTNLVAGQSDAHSATLVDEFEHIHGAELLKTEDIIDDIMVIKINKLYHRGISEKDIYEAVRGVWHASWSKAKHVKYVFGVYYQLIVGVYQPDHWYKVKDNPKELPSHTALSDGNRERIFFTCNDYSLCKDSPFLYKSIEALGKNQKAQNPITYIIGRKGTPKCEMKNQSRKDKELSDTTSSVHHNLMLIKINKLYHDGMNEQELYDAVRGVWKAKIENAKKVDYVLGLYKGNVVAAYQPKSWYKVKDNPSALPPHVTMNEGNKDRIFFVCEDSHLDADNPYLGQHFQSKAQNPISYIWNR